MKPKKEIIIPSKNKNKVKSSISSFETSFFLKPQNIFLFLASIFGLCFVFTIPPFQIPDEASHMFRAYQLTRFHLQTEEQNNIFGNYRPPSVDNKVVGNYLPSSFDSVQMRFFYLKFQPRNKIKKEAIIDACSIKLQPEKEKFIEMTAGNFSFLNYIPQIPAIVIGRLFNLNVLPVFYLGRLFALAFFIFFVWFSIRILPFGGYTFLVLGLMPMSLTLAGSYSADCVIIAFSFLTLALIFHLSIQKNVNLKNKRLILLISILCFFGVLKLIYLPWVLMILLIPSKVFEKKSDYYLALLITFFMSTILALGWTYLMFNNQIHNASIPTPEIIETPSHQIGLLTHKPLLIFDILHDTWTAKHEFYSKSLIGIFGYLDTNLPKWIYNFFYVLLLSVALMDFNKIYKLSVYQRISILFLSVSICLATIFAMFIFDGWESKASLIVEGVQGRYFIPPLIAFSFVVYGLLPFEKPLFVSIKILSVVLFIICFIILYQTEHVLYLRYFKEGTDYFKFIAG